MTPQAIAAMSLKMAMPRILARVGYRGVLISNTMILGLQIALFATIGVGTPVWLMVAQTFCFGFFSSLQYTSMNTLVYADVSEVETSSASSIAATMQQMAISFGVATASLATAFFIPGSLPFERAANDSGHPPGVLRPGRTNRFVHYRFSRIEKRRWRSREPA
jgi:MFS family permease